MSDRIRLKTIALPVEHGGWGFLLEPIVLALAVAPTLPGGCYAVAAAAGFLARHPLKLFLRNRGRLAASPRSRVAGWVTLAYLGIAGAAMIAAVILGGWKPLVPLAVALPFSVVYLRFDTKNRGRGLLPELSGPMALATVAVAIALAAGWPGARAAALWVLLMARTIPSIFYVRARLRLERRKPIGRASVMWNHVVFFAAVVLLAWRGLAPKLALAGLIALAIRAALGLSGRRRFTRPQQIGVFEIFAGLVYIVLVAVGIQLGM